MKNSMDKLKPKRLSTPGKSYRNLLIKIVLLIVLSLAGSAVAYWFVFHPPRHPVKQTPATVGLEYKNVEFESRVDNVKLKGWLLPSGNSDRTVIIAHGYRSNRLQDDVPALSLAEKLVGAGYNVLMFDFRNCGKSGGNMTSVGQYEVRDLLGAIDFIKKSPKISRHIVLLGFSMGAATSIMAGAREPAVDAVIADSPFADLSQHLSAKTFPFHWLLLPGIGLLTGLTPGKVSPVKEVTSLSPRPLLLIHGSADRKVPKHNSEKILQAAGPSASLWVVPGAKHLKAYGVASEDYTSKVLQFLESICDKH